MDSTAAEDDAPKAKRTSGAGDVDLISGLDEDVLLRVLELVGDTRDASRTCVLSRRWLGLWKRIPKLRFASCYPTVCTAACSAAERHDALNRQYISCVNDILAERCGAASDPDYYYYYPVSSLCDVLDLRTNHPEVSMAAAIATELCDALELSTLEQFVSCVNDILARRAQSSESDCAIESLAISYTTTATGSGHKPREQVTSAFVDAAQGWIQYAFRRHGLKSFTMDLHGLKCYLVGVGMHLEWKEEEEQELQGKSKTPTPVVLLDELPNPPPIGMETMHLALGGASVRLPAANNNAMKFASLVDLSLEKMMITNGGARLLAHLVSPANCPNLQKLRLNQLRLPDDDDFNDEEMKLESSVLSELWIDHVNLTTSLELATPGLRIFHIDHCFVEKLTVSAPRLEEFAFFRLGYPPRCLEVGGDLPCVRSLKICLRAFRSCYSGCTLAPVLAAANEINVRLLGQCISITSLDVTLKGQQTSKTNVDIIRSMVPQLPQITSLTVNVSGDVFHRYNFGTSVESILTRFSNLRNLSLHLPRFRFIREVSTTYPTFHLWALFLFQIIKDTLVPL
jgi:hypothetical protein